jgi:MFS transporter, DHA2 family, multidrug resistance protein
VKPNLLERNYTWIASGILMIGIFMTLLDTTIVDIVLPKMISSLNTDTLGIQWVIIIYLIGSAIAMTLVGWLGTFIEHRHIFAAGMLLFTVMSFFCSRATSLSEMVFSRLIQGIGEGFVVTIGLTMMYNIFPSEKRGIATGLYGLGAMMAPAIGPTLGGLLTEHFDWPSIFFVNLPVGAIGILLAFFVLRHDKPTGRRAKLNLVSFILLTVSLSTLITFLAKGQENDWLQSGFILRLIAAFIVSTILYFRWELRSPVPLLDLRLFKIRNFSMAVGALCGVSFVAYGALLLGPLYMSKLRGYPTLTAGLTILPLGLVTALFSILGGLLADRVSVKRILLVGIIGLGFGSWLLTQVDLYTSKYVLALWFVVFGSPMGLCFPPAQTIAFSDLPEQKVNMGSGITNVVRLVTGSIATSVCVTVLQRTMDSAYVGLSSAANASHQPLVAATRKLELYLGQHGTPAGLVRPRVNMVLQAGEKALAGEIAFQHAFWWLVCAAFLSLGFVLLIRWEKGKIGRKLAGH